MIYGLYFQKIDLSGEKQPESGFLKSVFFVVVVFLMQQSLKSGSHPRKKWQLLLGVLHGVAASCDGHERK